MRKFTFFFLFLLSFSQVNAQLLNADFETWVNGSPENWFTTNILGFSINVTQSSDAYSGSSAVRGEVVSFMGSVLPPVIQAGQTAEGFNIDQLYYTFKGYFKFSPLGGDVLIINLLFYNETTPIAAGTIELGNAMSSYTEVKVPVTVVNENLVPAKLIMQVLISGPSGEDAHLGSVFFADNFSLSTEITDVNDNVNQFTFRLDQNYPNPFNPVTNIKYSLPVQSEVTFSVYNALGNEIKKETYFRTAGEHNIIFNAEGLSSGVYFYTINAGNYSATRKFILMK